MTLVHECEPCQCKEGQKFASDQYAPLSLSAISAKNTFAAYELCSNNFLIFYVNNAIPLDGGERGLYSQPNFAVGRDLF